MGSDPSGNPRGRPPKGARESFSNPVLFPSGFIEISYQGKQLLVQRREALILKLYQSALNGSVQAMIYLDRKWHDADKRIAELMIELEELETRFRHVPEQRIPPLAKMRMEGMRQFIEMYQDKLLT
jgi:hypothetical protein